MFSGFPFLIGALVNIQSSASSKHTVKRYINGTVEVCPNYGLVRKHFYVPYCAGIAIKDNMYMTRSEKIDHSIIKCGRCS